MTREEIRRKYQRLSVRRQNLEKGIKASRGTVRAAIDKFVDVCSKIEKLQSQCPHPEVISKQIFSTPDCKQEACADCGQVFKECECLLCRATEEFSDPFRPG